jgi:hypothetical protein
MDTFIDACNRKTCTECTNLATRTCDVCHKNGCENHVVEGFFRIDNVVAVAPVLGHNACIIKTQADFDGAYAQGIRIRKAITILKSATAMLVGFALGRWLIS